MQRLHLMPAGALALVAALGAQPADAQELGVPVLQNAFSNPGITLAVNYGAGDRATAAGVAAAWGASRLPIQLSAGAAVYDPDAGARTGTWGARVMALAPKLAHGNVGLAAFAGVGGVREDGVTELRAPFGVSLGYRRTLGATRGVSGYLTPFYSWSHFGGDGESRSAGTFRVSFGVDVAIFPGFGATVGYETGGTAEAGEPGPVGGVFGVGLSYALRWPR